MRSGEKYWAAIEPYWNAISIDSPEEFELTFNRIPRSLGLLYAAHFCQSEVCNGGFTQFFWNSTGVLGPEAAEGFKAIGQPGLADIVGQAMAQLSFPYNRNKVDRHSILARLADETGDHLLQPDARPTFKQVQAFRPLEREFYSLLRNEGGGFEAAADRYAERI